MALHGKPRIGFLGIMQELYDKMLPGITERQADYAKQVCDQLSDVADFDFPGPARNRADVERILGDFNRQGLDGVMIVMLTYGPALRTVRALGDNELPVLLANIQPVPEVTPEWDMSDLTYNQGVHGAQDMGNALLRTNTPCCVVTDDWKSGSFKEYVGDWAAAAQTVTRLKSLRIAAVGRMPGMGDILVDPMALMRKLGPEIHPLAAGEVYSLFESATDAEIDAVIAENEANFEIDPKLSAESHRYAAQLQVAFQKLMDQGFGAFTAYFGTFGSDGRFKQLPLMAASNLMAKGYGYGAEGDPCSTALVSMGHTLIGDAHFTEMYAMDFPRDSILMSHMGEGNWKVARKDRPIKLIDRPLGIGDLDNPPTVVFMAQPGPATLVDLVTVEGDDFHLIVSQGEVLDTEELPNVEMPYFHFRPNTGVRSCLNGWLACGGTHHQCMTLGDERRRWELLADLLNIQYIEV